MMISISRLFRMLTSLPLCAAMVAGCGGKRGSSPTPDASRDTASSAKGSPAISPASAPAKLEMLEFDAAALPKEYAHAGKVIGGARWRDANGENTLIISRRESPHGDPEAYERREEIFGYLYLPGPDSARLLWKIKDQADNYCDNGEGLVSKVEVADIDGDGVAENAFIYNVQGTCDVSPKPFKLMMHSGATKLAIRGTSRVNPSDTIMGGEKNFDPAFDSAPKALRDYASRMWDATMKTKYIGPPQE
jgi:hypothetical protein